jgi:hypothetical protein
MPSPETWGLLERYRELIINGLDLGSFLLITNELVPSMASALGKASRFSVVLMLLYEYFYVSKIVAIDTGSLALAIAVFIVLCGTLIGLYVSLRERVQEIKEWTQKNALVLGISLFFLSRLIGFAAALHQVLAASE